jgi:hypothetical protein
MLNFASTLPPHVEVHHGSLTTAASHPLHPLSITVPGIAETQCPTAEPVYSLSPPHASRQYQPLLIRCTTVPASANTRARCAGSHLVIHMVCTVANYGIICCLAIFFVFTEVLLAEYIRVVQSSHLSHTYFLLNRFLLPNQNK